MLFCCYLDSWGVSASKMTLVCPKIFAPRIFKALKVHVGYSRPRCLPMAVQTVTHVCAGVDGTCVDRPDTLKAGGEGSRVLVIKTLADPELSAHAV